MIKSFLNGNTIAYEINTDSAGWAERGRSVVDCMREYPTYGDGTVKHGASYKVRIENFVDCLISLYDYLTAGVNGNLVGTREEVMKRIEAYWPHSHNPGDKKIAFFAGLKYVEGKRRFYDKDDMKVSSAPGKQYDKRWEEVPPWADGSFDATWRFVKTHCWSVDIVNDFALFDH